MSVTEYLMKPGNWNVDLVETTPTRILDQIKVEAFGFAQLVILPTHMDPRLVSDAGMLSIARYTGLYRAQEGRTRLTGGHVNLLLGDEDDKGDVIETAITTAAGTLPQWFTALAYSAFTNGTVTAPGGPAYTDPVQWVTRRKAWEKLCTHFGVEWQVTPNLLFNVGTPAALYGTVPKLVMLRNAGTGGRDATLTGLSGSAALDVDVEDYTVKVIYKSSSGAVTASGSNPYTAPNGGPLIMDKLIDESSSTVAAPATRASQELAKVNTPRYQLQITPDVFDVGALAQVGAPIYVYDPLGGTYDTANPVTYRGRGIFPILSRITGMTWPIQRGMGVYLRRSDGTNPLWVDLTPYVVYDELTAG